MSGLDIVLPCLNEAEALPAVLASLPPDARAIVVDNGSTDDSARIARMHGALVVTEQRRGFGAAVHAGILAATAPLVAVADADASFDLRELGDLRALLDRGEADLVLGRRTPTERGAWPWHARLANRYLSARVSAAAGVDLHDIGPMRIARREPLLALGLRDRRSGYPLEMVLAASQAGWRLREIDVTYRPRVGRSKVTGTVRGTVTAIGDMSRILRERAS